VRTSIAGAAAALILMSAAAASAQTTFQTPDPRWFLGANGLFQTGSGTLTEQFDFQEFAETGTIESTYEANSAIGFDGSVGVRVWRNVGAGVAVSTYAGKEGGEVTARIPHPFHFNQHREVSGEAGLTRKETAIHASLLYIVPAGERFQVILGAGPTFFQAEQSFVNDVLYTQEYPFDTATFNGVDIDNESASGIGFNASLDVAWRFSRSFGAGALVRYTQGTVPFTPGDREVDVTVGGVQAGVGIRVIF
jgi:opacity protein-like surface antigen